MQESSTPAPPQRTAGTARTRHSTSWLKAISPLLILPLFEYLIVGPLPVGTQYLIMLPGMIMLPAFVALAYVLVGPFLLIRRESRSQTLRRLALCILFVASTIAGLRISGTLRNDAFYRLAERSSTLVTAIQNYHRIKGTPPSTLDDLVPDFLEAIPGTGMAAYPVYEYFAGDLAHSHDQNPWILLVNTPCGGINFDEFLYFPLQNYPQRGYGGWLQRVRDWAYVHE